MEELKKEVKKMKAITLIALVITIIVLIILAAIVINLSLGNNGIFSRAKEASKGYSNAQISEKETLDNYDFKLASTRDSSDNSPVGTVIACIRQSAPEGYLACDGTEYNISDYPDLAEEINKVYSGYNTTTAGKFKVPDLRGEFLRGTGTNSHTNQGDGDDIGKHQDGTQHNYNMLPNSSNDTYYPYCTGDVYVSNVDKAIDVNSSTAYYTTKPTYHSSGWNVTDKYTARPTNTSVLYCIKY